MDDTLTKRQREYVAGLLRTDLDRCQKYAELVGPSHDKEAQEIIAGLKKAIVRITHQP